jgi:hypothetical protein
MVAEVKEQLLDLASNIMTSHRRANRAGTKTLFGLDSVLTISVPCARGQREPRDVTPPMGEYLGNQS